MLEFLPHLLGLAVLLVLSGFFSGAETALFSLTRVQARRMREGTPGERAATGLLREPQRLLSTLLVGNMAVNVMTASIVASLARRLFAGGGIGVAIGVSTFLLLVFGEVTPKTVAVRHARIFARVVSMPLRVMSRVITPVRIVLRWVTTGALRVFGLRHVAGWGTLTRDELVAMLNVGELHGATEARERALAEHILELAETNARDIMVPRTEVRGLDDSLTLSQAFAEACRLRHSRLPVYHGDLDDIWGVLSVVDLPRWRGTASMNRPLADYRPPGDSGAAPTQSPLYRAHSVPESAGIEHLLAHMRKERAQLVVLVDEYGGTAGILTMDDILAGITGHLSSADGDAVSGIVVADDHVMVDGGTHVRELGRKSGIELPQNSTDTVGGYVMEVLGRLPRAGDVAEDGAYRFLVINMAGRRVGTLRVEQLTDGAGGAQEPC